MLASALGLDQWPQRSQALVNHLFVEQQSSRLCVPPSAIPLVILSCAGMATSSA